MADKGNRNFQSEEQARPMFSGNATSHHEASDPGEQNKTGVADQKTGPQKVDISEIALKEDRRQQQDLVDDRKEIQDHKKQVAGPGFSNLNRTVEYHFKKPVGVATLFSGFLLKCRV